LQEKIYELSLELLQNSNYFNSVIVPNMKINYYWSQDWSEEFYILLAKLGFISTTYETSEGLVLLPELQFEYGVLEFKNLNIDSKVKKLIKEDKFELSFDTSFNQLLEKIIQHHSKYNWLKGPYLTLMQMLHQKQENYPNFKLHSIELLSKESKELIAGEIGYVIGNTYTSLTGFSSREKRYNNCGKLQLVLLAQHLQKRGFNFWNLGHPHMEYKKRLGSKVYTRESFLNIWQEATKNRALKDIYE